MSDLPITAGFEIVNLVDRTGKGGCEIIFDGVRVPFKPGQKERPVPQFLAEWILSVDQHKVHTKDGEFVNRFAVKEDAPEDFRLRLGRAACDTTPIEIDTDRLEGWDTDNSIDVADRGTERVINLGKKRADFGNDAAPGGAAAYANKR